MGVALLLPQPLAAEIDGLRRAVGERIERIPGHVTLVPPLNFHDHELPAALAVLRAAAEATAPFVLTFGPPATFLPVNPVLYLAVGGDLDAVRELRRRVMQPPLHRKPQWTFEPHLTLCEQLEPSRIAAATAAMADYRAEVTVDRVHLLEQRHWDGGPTAWRPVADAAFGPPAVVGRGGVELELAVTERLDPVAMALLAGAPAGSAPAAPAGVPLAVTARRGGEVVGVARGWTAGAIGRLACLVTVEGERGIGVGSQLLAAFGSAAAEVGVAVLSASPEPASPMAAFLGHRGWVPSGTDDELVRDLRG